MNARLGVLVFLAVAVTFVTGSGTSDGRSVRPSPLPDKALYARIAAIPETELTSAEMALAQADEVAETMMYVKCARAGLENAAACPWLIFNEQAESGFSVGGALQAMILGLRQGSLPTHLDLFSRYGGSAAFADMLVFDRPLQPAYATLITPSDGEQILQRNFEKSSLNSLLELVQGEPSSGLDAVLKYLFSYFAKYGNDIPLVRIVELGPAAVTRFHIMHELGMLAGESDHRSVPCAHADAREYDILVKLLSATQHPALVEVRAEAWPRVPMECRRLSDYDAEIMRKYGTQDLNRVSFAVRANAAYRRRLHEPNQSQAD